jgi:hypothetical protein
MAFLDELAQYGDRVSVRPQDETGLLDLDTLLGTPRPDTLVYCCGPEPLLAAVEQRCSGWPRGALHVERFAPRPQTAPVRAEAFEVVLQQSELSLTVPPDRSILSVVEEAGRRRPLLVRRGAPAAPARPPSSTACPTTATRSSPTTREQANDCMMICVSRSTTARLVLDL